MFANIADVSHKHHSNCGYHQGLFPCLHLVIDREIITTFGLVLNFREQQHHHCTRFPFLLNHSKRIISFLLLHHYECIIRQQLINFGRARKGFKTAFRTGTPHSKKEKNTPLHLLVLLPIITSLVVDVAGNAQLKLLNITEVDPPV